MDRDNPVPVVRRTERNPLTPRAGRRARNIPGDETAGQEQPTTTGSWWLVLPSVAIGLAASG
ncbi:hypothetical protein TVH25_15440 [Rhodococcus sp. 7Tela_A2]|uniref:hypothetical protein n=1 Tax=Rhodococcus sp. 7Tela_A2 TaxID=3093744 RepID=UPI003BB64F44